MSPLLQLSHATKKLFYGGNIMKIISDISLLLLKRRYCFILTASLLLLATTAISGPIENLQPGHWLEIPNSKLASVAPNPIPAGNSGVSSVMEAWSGGAFDTTRNRLIVWGGGHGDYSGNEIYAFDLNTLQWNRLTEPSPINGWKEGDIVYPQDGGPVSRHTYGSLEYLPPPFDKFFVAGGSVLWKNSTTKDFSTLQFDLLSKKWTAIPNSVPNPSIGAICAYDPIAERIWFHSAGGGSYLSEFNPKTNTWIKHGNQWTEKDAWILYGWTGAIDPIRRKFVAIGNNKVYVWDIDKTGNIANTKLNTTGGNEIISSQNPGFVYDPVADKFIAWSGGSYVYQLNFETSVWTKIEAAATNRITPTNPSPNGTYGRFRYVPSMNVFVLVNNVNENVFIYKLDDHPALDTPNKANVPKQIAWMKLAKPGKKR